MKLNDVTGSVTGVGPSRVRREYLEFGVTVPLGRDRRGGGGLTVEKVTLQLSHPEVVRPDAPIDTARTDQVVLDLDRGDRVSRFFQDLERRAVLRPEESG